MLISAIGLVALHRADQLYGRSALFERQLIWICIAWPAMLAATRIPYQVLTNLSPLFYVGCLALLVVVLFMPSVNGSRRWIPLGFFDFQPSEPARLAFIMALAHYLMHRESQRSVRGLFVPFVVTVFPLLLILREPDLGTSMLFLPILYVMLFTAGAKPLHLIAALLIGVAMLPFLWQQMSAEQRSRVTSVFTQKDGGLAPPGDGFHLHQSKQLIALGGVEGSRVRTEPLIEDDAAYRLPSARTDFIFCIIAERYGLGGVLILFLLYGSFVVAGTSIAGSCTEPFGRLVAIGIVTMIGTQMLINVAMTVGLMPITGITLPFCSYGGSSLLSACLATGLLCSIAVHPSYNVGGEPAWEKSRHRQFT